MSSSRDAFPLIVQRDGGRVTEYYKRINRLRVHKRPATVPQYTVSTSPISSDHRVIKRQSHPDYPDRLTPAAPDVGEDSSGAGHKDRVRGCIRGAVVKGLCVFKTASFVRRQLLRVGSGTQGEVEGFDMQAAGILSSLSPPTSWGGTSRPAGACTSPWTPPHPNSLPTSESSVANASGDNSHHTANVNTVVNNVFFFPFGGMLEQEVHVVP
ncbi:hypothetical protein BU17DRAFT_88838 [Hysterangium stoloniferum]|nr:hypothetical protein BU17DRAFT_88838 [Hysterangium stoloniferum]